MPNSENKITMQCQGAELSRTYQVHVDRSSDEQRIAVSSVATQVDAEDLAYENTKKADGDGTECWAASSETFVKHGEYVVIVDRSSEIIDVVATNEEEASAMAYDQFSQLFSNINYSYSIAMVEILESDVPSPLPSILQQGG